MKKLVAAILLCLCVVVLFCGCAVSWDSVKDDTAVARTGDMTIDYRLLKYYHAQQSISEEIAQQLFRDSDIQQQSTAELTMEDSLQQLMAQAAVAQCAGADIAVDKETAEQEAREELGASGYDYMQNYTEQLKAKMDLTDDELLQTAAEMAYIRSNCDAVLKDVVQKLPSGLKEQEKRDAIYTQIKELADKTDVAQLFPREKKASLDYGFLADQAMLLF
ncbi:MAG: hypothetical protein VB081_05820 [Christensenella sp.]|uniref:hypothetical protein n=1 Tax=Christensenella sp. TaxID=1935934 RepID=UPI002B201119|nr:hypothetical protein [Christensenella sp.]MEA5002999.1 hypothetical protein [Christensenella sp.]